MEEASSRFGVSLRKREPSTDSCNSLKHTDRTENTSKAIDKSGSPISVESSSASSSTSGLNNDNHSSSLTKIKPRDKLEAKLVAEIKVRSEQYQRKQKEVVPNNMPSRNDMQFYHPDKPIFVTRNHTSQNEKNITSIRSSPDNNGMHDHVSQLVSELAETINLPKTIHSDIAKKNTLVSLKNEVNDVQTAKGFKAQLKKVDAKKSSTSATDDTKSFVDFKSRLRKVENNNENETPETTLESKNVSTPDTTLSSGKMSKNNHENIINSSTASLIESNVIDRKKTEIKANTKEKCDKIKTDTDPKGCIASNEDEEKRKSTGELKKLWESKEGSYVTPSNESQAQLSPKATAQSSGASNNNTNIEDESDTLNQTKKPIIPTKPLKLVSIYATPVQVKLNADSNIINSTSSTTSSLLLGTNNNANSDSQISRDTILHLIQLLECTLKIPINSITSSQWLQLSEKLNILQTSCVTFADNATMAPHSKFQFRELVTRVENQSRNLRSAGSKNIQDNEKLVYEVRQSLKQISNALCR